MKKEKTSFDTPIILNAICSKCGIATKICGDSKSKALKIAKAMDWIIEFFPDLIPAFDTASLCPECVKICRIKPIMFTINRGGKLGTAYRWDLESIQ